MTALPTNTPLIYLAELTVWDPVAVATRVLRYTSGTGFMTAPADTPASTLYDARLLQPALVTRHAFGNGTTSGGSALPAVGDLVLANADGALDTLLTYGFDGRTATIKVGALGAAFSSYTPVTYVMEQPEAGTDTITVRLSDVQLTVDLPLQATKYAGSNALPAGVEGVTDLKGKPKPVLFGNCFNVTPRLVNTDKFIYQVRHGGALQSVTPYLKGLAITAGTAHANQAALEAAATGAGTYDTWLAGGCFRLGTAPTGELTCDAVEGAATANRTAAQMWKNVLTLLGKSSGDYSAADITALDTAAPYELGGYWPDETTGAAALDAIAGSVGAAWFQDHAGLLRIKQLTAPSGSPVLVVTVDDLLKPLTRIPLRDPDKGVPVYRHTVRYGRNYTVQQDAGLDATVTTARRALLSLDARDAAYTDTSVQTAHLLAPALTEDSLLTTAADALAEATRRQVLRATRRDCFELLLRLTDVTAVVDLLDVVQVVNSRFSLSGGKLFRVLSTEPDARAGTILLTVWG